MVNLLKCCFGMGASEPEQPPITTTPRSSPIRPSLDQKTVYIASKRLSKNDNNTTHMTLPIEINNYKGKKLLTFPEMLREKK